MNVYKNIQISLQNPEEEIVSEDDKESTDDSADKISENEIEEVTQESENSSKETTEV